MLLLGIGFLIGFGILMLRDYLPGVAARVESVCVFAGFFFATLLSAVTGIEVLVLIEVVVLVLVEMALGHRRLIKGKTLFSQI